VCLPLAPAWQISERRPKRFLMRVINTQKSAKRRCEKSANHATSQANLGENMSKYQKLPRMKKKSAR